MRLTLNFPRPNVEASPAPRLLPSKQRSFSDRLAAGRKPEPTQPAPAALDDVNERQVLEAALRERIAEYLLQNELMQSIMRTPGPLPDRVTD